MHLQMDLRTYVLADKPMDLQKDLKRDLRTYGRTFGPKDENIDHQMDLKTELRALRLTVSLKRAMVFKKHDKKANTLSIKEWETLSGQDL